MTRSPNTWHRALRALLMACALVLIVLFVAGNFVLVDVRVWGLDIETRLAWAVVVPAVLAFIGGMLWCRPRDVRLGPGSTRALR